MPERTALGTALGTAAQTGTHNHEGSMKADKPADRLFFLERLPNLHGLGRLRIGESVEEVLQAGLALELDAMPQLKRAIACCGEVYDDVSRDWFAESLASEDSHGDTIERPFDLIEHVGIQNDIELQSTAETAN